MHTRPDATFPNCPLRSPRATELNYYNGDEWEAGVRKDRRGVVVTATRSSTLHPLLSVSLKHTPQKTGTVIFPGYDSD